MSKIARWCYTNKATVYPLIGYNGKTGVYEYGQPYLIDCTWSVESKVATDDNGKEFVSRQTIYTESWRNGVPVRLPQRDDYIATGDTMAEADPIAAGAVKIVTVRDDDMSFFGDNPDYKVMT